MERCSVQEQTEESKVEPWAISTVSDPFVAKIENCLIFATNNILKFYIEVLIYIKATLRSLSFRDTKAARTGYNKY